MFANTHDYQQLERLLSLFLENNNVDFPLIVIPTTERTFWNNMTGYNSYSCGLVAVAYREVDKIQVTSE